jgi:hypothetical protein
MTDTSMRTSRVQILMALCMHDIKAQSPSKGAGAQQRPVIWQHDRYGDADEPRADFDGIVHA